VLGKGNLSGCTMLGLPWMGGLVGSPCLGWLGWFTLFGWFTLLGLAWLVHSAWLVHFGVIGSPCFGCLGWFTLGGWFDWFGLVVWIWVVWIWVCGVFASFSPPFPPFFGAGSSSSPFCGVTTSSPLIWYLFHFRIFSLNLLKIGFGFDLWACPHFAFSISLFNYCLS